MERGRDRGREGVKGRRKKGGKGGSGLQIPYVLMYEFHGIHHLCRKKFVLILPEEILYPFIIMTCHTIPVGIF